MFVITSLTRHDTQDLVPMTIDSRIKFIPTDLLSTGLEEIFDSDPSEDTPSDFPSDFRLVIQKSSGGRDTVVPEVSATHLQLSILPHQTKLP